VAIGLGIDVYGTLVDSIGMRTYLHPLIGDQAGRFAEMWRAKQLEYTFRRAAMGQYENFDICTHHALEWTAASLNIHWASGVMRQILEQYLRLNAYPDGAAGLASLKQQGHALYAFSNGVESSLRALLEHAGLIAHLDGIVSVDEIKTFKPDPRVYHHLAGRLGLTLDAIWLVSSNPFDVIGAKAAGLKAAWIKRDASAVFDPWGMQPDLTSSDLNDFARRLRGSLGAG
jgi:2-haloacid dehalogenase